MTAPAPGFVGVLMLDTRFPRLPGDIGNAQTFARLGIDVAYRTVQGASPARIVQRRDPALLAPFIAAAIDLVQHGARLVSTSCGFLAAWQTQLAQAVPVPVVTSSLLACARLPSAGILTIDAAALDARMLRAAGVPAGTPVQGVAAGCEFQRRILGDDSTLDLAQAQADVVAAACRLVQAHPGIDTIVLECTNMPPYRDAVHQATGRVVVDIVTELQQAWAALPVAR